MGIVGLDNLAQDIVEFYSEGIDAITASTFAAAKECAESCCEKIKAAAPRGSGKYRQGWVVRKTQNGYMVYNKTEPHLEMILENGHNALLIIIEGKTVHPHGIAVLDPQCL